MADVTEAASTIRPYIRRTPLLDVQVDGRRLLLKLEQLQRSGSFKLRGALNAMLARPRAAHVVTASGGNHGLGVATAASVLGLPATVAIGPRATAAVEPYGCQCLADALAAGRPVDCRVDSAAASALGAARIGELPFAILQRGLVASVLVTDAELLAARDLLWEHLRIAAEPAAEVPFAAWLAGRVGGQLPCMVVCGANTDWAPKNS